VKGFFCFKLRLLVTAELKKPILQNQLFNRVAAFESGKDKSRSGTPHIRLDSVAGKRNLFSLNRIVSATKFNFG
jgi:hypothetical protein